MKKILFIILLPLFLVSWKPAGPDSSQPYDLVFCVDLSASTNGVLIDIRDRIWNIANGILSANENTGLRIAFVGYARPSFGGSDGFVRIVSNLTNDFDFLAYQLYQMKPRIEKGDQFVPHALQETFERLTWSKEPGARKAVYLVGNGSAYSGSVNLVNVCERFRDNGIKIHSVFVDQGKENDTHENGYKRIAEITNGKFYRIRATSFVSLNRYQSEGRSLVNMNNSFNSTMMFFTKDAVDRKKFSFETDKRILETGMENFVSRLRFKGSAYYLKACSNFDLTSYYIVNGRLPEKINYDFLFKEEKVFNEEEINNRVRNKALARLRLTDEINYMFSQTSADSVKADENRIEGFVLAR